MDLFDTVPAKDLVGTPLAEKLRPQSLQELLGQDSVVGKGSMIQRMVERGQLSSMIFWGPPGCGKTSLARSLSGEVKSEFIAINAVDSGVKQIKQTGESARHRRRMQNRSTILFVDEIHRFNKSQQDILLPYVESGDFALVGATTENPAYYLNRALLSRCPIVEFHRLERDSLTSLFLKACNKLELEASELCDPEAQSLVLSLANGDGRKVINFVEILANASTGELLGSDEVDRLLGSMVLPHDKDSDQHYDLISALIKSVRGSDVDASLYYLARLVEGGEDPRFICRRLMILASEDIGNADPRALSVAVDGFRVVETIGLPEGRITLAQVVSYLACAPKSNASYVAISRAQELVKKTGSVPVPKALRSSSTRAMKDLGYGKGYKYSQDGPRGFVSQQFLPDEIQKLEQKLYEPSERGYEKHMSEYLKWIRGEKKT